MEESKMKVIGFEVTLEEWKILKSLCLKTGNNMKTLFRPYVSLLLEKAKKEDLNGTKK